MNHEKTFAAIKNLQEVEIELHRLKNALEMANKALDAQRTWQGLTDEDWKELSGVWWKPNENEMALLDWAEAKLKEKNT